MATKHSKTKTTPADSTTEESSSMSTSETKPTKP